MPSFMKLMQCWVKISLAKNGTCNLVKIEEFQETFKNCYEESSRLDCLKKILHLAEDIEDKNAVYMLQNGMRLLYLSDTLTRDYSNFMHYYFLADPDFNVNDSLNAGGDSCTLLIHYYARMGSAAHLKLLLQRGAEVDKEETGTEMTALMMACRYGDFAMVKVLLEAGANPLKGDRNNRNALSLSFHFASECTFQMILENILAKNGHTVASVIKYITDIHIWHKQMVHNSNSKAEILLLLTRWEKYLSGRCENMHGLSIIIDNISKNPLYRYMFNVFFNLANDRHDSLLIKLMLRNISRRGTTLPCFPSVQHGFVDSINKMCQLNILSVYSSVLCKMDKDYISHYRSCEQWQHLFPRWEKLPGWKTIGELERNVSLLDNTRQLERVVYNLFKVYWIIAVLDLIGIISNFGIAQHFLWFLIDFHYSTIFRKSYKGLLCLFLVMKHPHLWKYFYGQCLKDDYSHTYGWERLMREAYRYSEWYSTTPRNDVAFLPMGRLLSFSQSNTCHPATVCNIGSILMKPHVSGYFQANSFKEGQSIALSITKCLWKVSEYLDGGPDHRFSFTPVLSGSAAEGTKTGYLDEFDFLLEMKHLRDKFDSFPLETIQTTTTVEINALTTDTFDIQVLLEDFRNALNGALKLYRFPAGFALESLIPTNPSVKPFTFVLQWRGECFRDLSISVDLVPAFRIDYEKVTRILHIFHCREDFPIYIIPKNVGLMNTDMRLSFSLQELGLLRNYPACVTHGYRLAKAMRHKEVCPAVETTRGQYAMASEYISSYMLKTCLFHAMSDKSQSQIVPAGAHCEDFLCSFSIELAIKIYRRMGHFVQLHDGKIPHYFHINSDICSRYQVVMRRGEEEEKLMAKKTRIVRFFIGTITDLLRNYVQASCQCKV